MKRLLLRIGLVVMLAACGINGSARAQDTVLPAQGTVPVTTMVPGQQVEGCSSCGCRAGTEECGTRRPICDWIRRQMFGSTDAVINCMNSKGCGCMGTHNSHGCMSTYGQYIFFFGSCREFFGDPCQPPALSNQPYGRLCTLCGK